MKTTAFRTDLYHLFDKISFTDLRERLPSISRYLTVQKLLIIASLLIILLFDVFHLYTDPTFTAPVGLMGFEIERLLLAVLLLFLFFTEPPRSMWVRGILGAAATALFIAALQLLFAYQIGVMSCILYIEVSIVVGLEALESYEKLGRVPHFDTGRE